MVVETYVSRFLLAFVPSDGPVTSATGHTEPPVQLGTAFPQCPRHPVSPFPLFLFFNAITTYDFPTHFLASSSRCLYYPSHPSPFFSILSHTSATYHATSSFHASPGTRLPFNSRFHKQSGYGIQFTRGSEDILFSIPSCFRSLRRPCHFRYWTYGTPCTAGRGPPSP